MYIIYDAQTYFPLHLNQGKYYHNQMTPIPLATVNMIFIHYHKDIQCKNKSFFFILEAIMI